jgi:hypothetical protein
MLIPLVLVALGAVGYLSAAVARERGAPLRSMPATALRVGVGIAVIRVAVVYFESWRFDRATAGAGPVTFIDVIVAGADFGVEYVATTLFGARPWPGPLLIAALVSLTSVLLGFAWAWVRSRPRSGGAD